MMFAEEVIIFNCSGSILSNKAASAANLPHQWRNQMIRFNIRSGVGVPYYLPSLELTCDDEQTHGGWVNRKRERSQIQISLNPL